MFVVLKKFLKNTEYLCGSTIMIAAKRYPNEVEIEDLISDLQKNHVFVYVLSSDTPSGGSNPSAMFNVASRTNGYCAFSTEKYLTNLYMDARNLAFAPNQIVASKFLVSGTGRQVIPFKVLGDPGEKEYVRTEIVYQDHKMDGSLISLNVTVTDEFGNKQSCSGPDNTSDYTEFLTAIYAQNTVKYYMTIDYEYQERRQEVMLVRTYSDSYVPDYFLPFSN